MSARTIGVFICLVALAVSGRVTSAQQVVQLPLTYNADVVREPGGTITGGGIDPATNAGPGGRGFVTQSEAAANDPVDPHGLPDNRIISVPGGTVQLQPYNSNNCCSQPLRTRSATRRTNSPATTRWRFTAPETAP